MPALAIALALSSAVLSAPSAEEISRLEYAGDAPAALRLAERALAARPGDVTTRLAGACAAIETNQLERATALLEPLERGAPMPPRALVLRHLVALRKAHPTQSLVVALASAWHEAGRPDLAEDEPVLAAPSMTSLPPAEVTDAARRLLFAPPRDHDELGSLALEASRGVERQPVVVALQVLGTLASQPCAGDADARNQAVERSRLAAKRVLPENGYVALAALLARCPATWGRPAVDELARISSARVLGYPRERAFNELLSMAQGLEPQTARRRAISAWLALDVAVYQLQKLSPESLPDPVLQTVAGRSLETIGWHFASGTGWLERMVGLALVQRGARLTGDEKHSEQARRRQEPKRRAYQAWATLARQRGQWPFAAEWQEWTPDEVGRSLIFLKAVKENIEAE